MGKLNRREKILCACNECGLEVKPGNRFIHGHNGTRKDKLKSLPQPCACGCLEMAKPGNRYINGHNNHQKKSLSPAQLCKCGCLEMTDPGKKYVKGHYGKTKIKSPPQLCWCGCLGMTKPGNRFISGHNNGRKGTGKPQPLPKLCLCGCLKMANPGRDFINGHGCKNTGKPQPIPNHHPCECGCPELVASDKRFVSGHNSRVEHSMKDKHHTEESKVKIRQSHLGMKQTEEHIAHKKEGMEKARAEGKQMGYKKGSIPWNKGLSKANGDVLSYGRPRSDETKINMSIAATGKEKSESHKRNLALANTGKKASKKTIEKMSNSKIAVWAALTEQERNEWIANIQKANQVKQNKMEKKLEDVISQTLPNEYKFVGHGEVVIAGKIPDFININGQKKIIELFGDYWHKGETPQDRMEVFKPYGYETLVIWEHELENISRVKSKISKFNRMEV